MITVNNFSYRYPKTENWAIQSIDLTIEEGEFCAVIGPNGAGKSTLAYALSGYAPHFFRGECQGQITFGDIDLADSKLGELSADIGLVFQNPFNQISGARFTVREEIAFGLENLGIERSSMHNRIESALEIVGLTGLEDRSPFALSGGQQQRVAIASMLAMRPKLLILDEPTSQLDPQGTRDVFSALHNLAARDQMTIILIEHKLEWVATFADRVFLMRDGKLAAEGQARELFSSSAMRQSGLPSTRYAQTLQALMQASLIPESKSPPVTLDQSLDLIA